MSLKAPFKKESSSIFGSIYRPYLHVLFWSKYLNNWIAIDMVVDSGADYTLLPKRYVDELGVDLGKDATAFVTGGVGGKAKAYFLKEKQRVKIGNWERNIPLGVLEDKNVPPLMGRQGFMETFKVTFDKHITEIDE